MRWVGRDVEGVVAVGTTGVVVCGGGAGEVAAVLFCGSSFALLPPNVPVSQAAIRTMASTVARAPMTRTDPPIEWRGRSRMLVRERDIPPGAVGVRNGSGEPG